MARHMGSSKSMTILWGAGQLGRNSNILFITWMEQLEYYWIQLEICVRLRLEKSWRIGNNAYGNYIITFRLIISSQIQQFRLADKINGWLDLFVVFESYIHPQPPIPIMKWQYLLVVNLTLTWHEGTHSRHMHHLIAFSYEHINGPELLDGVPHNVKRPIHEPCLGLAEYNQLVIWRKDEVSRSFNVDVTEIVVQYPKCIQPCCVNL